ncbi:MAG: hypothetical protein SFU55_09195 [Methylophilus sp.]|nr:hypothetical protein [Methylophilus sp.]
MIVNVISNLKKIIILIVGMQLLACATAPQVGNLQKQHQLIQLGKTTKTQINASLGKPLEAIVEGDREIWIYADSFEVPFIVSVIPVVGDIADGVELIHKNRELIIQFDKYGFVCKSKLRDF